MRFLDGVITILQWVSNSVARDYQVCRGGFRNLNKYAEIVRWLNTICDTDCRMAVLCVRVNVVTPSLYR